MQCNRVAPKGCWPAGRSALLACPFLPHHIRPYIYALSSSETAGVFSDFSSRFVHESMDYYIFLPPYNGAIVLLASFLSFSLWMDIRVITF